MQEILFRLNDLGEKTSSKSAKPFT